MKFKSKIITIEKINENFKIFEFSKPQEFSSKPGQYNWLEINDVGRSPMAIASSNKENNLLFAVRKWGKMVEKLFELKVGDEISIDGPHGTYFPEFSNKHIYLVAGGSGITPIRSYIQSLTSKNDITLYYGGRTSGEFLFNDVIDSIETRLSISEPDSDWTGLTGNIGEHLLKDELKSNSIVFVCGPKPMLVDVCVKLRSKGFKNDQIYVSLEKFDKEGNVIGPVVNLNHEEIDF